MQITYFSSILSIKQRFLKTDNSQCWCEVVGKCEGILCATGDSINGYNLFEKYLGNSYQNLIYTLILTEQFHLSDFLQRRHLHNLAVTYKTLFTIMLLTIFHYWRLSKYPLIGDCDISKGIIKTLRQM